MAARGWLAALAGARPARPARGLPTLRNGHVNCKLVIKQSSHKYETCTICQSMICIALRGYIHPPHAAWSISDTTLCISSKKKTEYDV